MPDVKVKGNVAYTDPLGAQLAGLAGQQGYMSPAGFRPVYPGVETNQPQLWQWMQSQPNAGQASPTLFDYSNMQKIVDFLQNPQEIGAAGVFARSDEGPMGLSELERMYQDYVTGSQATQGALLEGLETGFKTDVEPIREAAMYQLMNETMPALAEGFAGTAGLASSDFARSLAEAGAGMETELGALETGLQENAAARRTEIAQAMPSLAATMLMTPSAWASGLAGTEAEMRQQEEMASEGGRLYQSFLTMMGLDPGAYTYVQTEAEPSRMEKFGQVMQGIGSLGPG